MSTEMINKRLQIIEELNAELNILKDQFSDALENDVDYQALVELEAKTKDEVKVKKAHVLEKPSYKKLAELIKEKRTEIKENKEALAQELVEYYKETGSLEFTDQNGETKRLKFSVKLVN